MFISLKPNFNYLGNKQTNIARYLSLPFRQTQKGNIRCISHFHTPVIHVDVRTEILRELLMIQLKWKGTWWQESQSAVRMLTCYPWPLMLKVMSLPGKECFSSDFNSHHPKSHESQHHMSLVDCSKPTAIYPIIPHLFLSSCHVSWVAHLWV